MIVATQNEATLEATLLGNTQNPVQTLPLAPGNRVIPQEGNRMSNSEPGNKVLRKWKQTEIRFALEGQLSNSKPDTQCAKK